MQIRERLSHIALGLGLERVAESLWTVDNVGRPSDWDAGWVPIYGTSNGSDIPDWRRDLAVAWSRVLAASHLAGRLLAIHSDFVCGDSVEVRLRPKDKRDAKLVEAVNDQLTEWEESVGLDQSRFEMLHEAGLIDGEVLLRISNASRTGPEIDILDPLEVTGYTVGPLRRVTSVQLPLTAIYPGAESREDVTLPVILRPSSGLSQAPGIDHGVVVRECHRPGTHPRGVGMLFNVIDKLRLDDKFLEADLKRAIMAGSYYGHAKVKGGKTKVEEAAAKLGKTLPGFGSLLVTSDNVEIDLMAAQMGLYEAKRGHEMAHRIIGLAAGVPLTWLGTGEDANRASAVEMGSPTYRHLQRAQSNFRSLLRILYGTVIEMKRQAGLVKITSDRYTLDVQLPELSGRDVAALADALQKLQLALDTAVDRRRLTNATAQAIEIEALQKLTDVELDPEAEGKPPEESDLDDKDDEKRKDAFERTAESLDLTH